VKKNFNNKGGGPGKHHLSTKTRYHLERKISGERKDESTGGGERTRWGHTWDKKKKGEWTKKTECSAGRGGIKRLEAKEVLHRLHVKQSKDNATAKRVRGRGRETERGGQEPRKGVVKGKQAKGRVLNDRNNI